MLSFWVVALAALAWLGVLFGSALYAERHPRVLAMRWPYIYTLSLAVYCTSWTFFGTVTQAARYGWPLPPTFVGTILLYALGAGLLIKMVRLARESNATSLADLIASRLGRDGWLAAVITLVAALGLIPYIALQLKAVTMSFALLTRSPDGGMLPAWQDSALYVAMAMALFAMLFGTRRASVAEHNRGLVLAMAFESLFKLLAMLAIGLFVWFGLPDFGSQPKLPETPPTTFGFVPLVVLGVLAMFTLPHQVHVGVVECRDESHVRTARWLFPLYMVLMALPLLPLARAGGALLGSEVPSDLYVLALPLSQGNEGLALLAFLGGLSAATGMVVVSTLSLSLMIGNHWLAPGMLRVAWAKQGHDLRGTVLMQRRAGIFVIMLLAWGYSRLVASNDALADVGALSMSALATLAPALAFAIWWPQTSPRAVIAGIVAGFLAWVWLLLLPTAMEVRGSSPDWLVQGPFGLSWLSPEGFVGLTGWSRLGRAVGGCLFVGSLVTVLWAYWRGETPRQQGSRGFGLEALRDAGRRFLPRERVDELLAHAPQSGPVPAVIEARMERELSAVLGAASARLLLDAARRETGDLDTVAAIVGEVSQEILFNQQVLEAALQNMSQGISVVDREQRLVAWNRRYAEMFGFPETLLQVGQPIADLTGWALQRMPHRGSDERALERRLTHMRMGTPHLTERVFPDGSIVEIRGNPMPGGGFVATYTDVTTSRKTERELKQANETLEQRVVERTALLETAKREAEHANDAKSRFLTAIGHDLLQPLNAAHLFVDALAQQLPEQKQRGQVEQIRGALDSTTDLLTGLLDMSRLEAGGLVPEPRDLPLSDVLEPLVSEFRVLAAERGLTFSYVPTRAWVHTDPQLLRRVLQNFLANAVRYTRNGGVLLGIRRLADGRLRIEVHDTGIGIPARDQRMIFEEFRRGEDSSGQGLGLGLSIAERIAHLLGTPLSLRSKVGQGSVFAVELVQASPAISQVGQLPGKRGLAGRSILAVDNDVVALSALQQVLEGWGCEVHVARNRTGAMAILARTHVDAWLFDYHLDEGDTGVAMAEHFRQKFAVQPCLILSADQTGVVRSRVLEAGFTLLAKPIRPLALKSVLDRLLSARTPMP